MLTETDACCGPMAAAFLHDYSTSIEVVSAGRNPAETIEPLMITAMKECLVDLSGYQPKNVTEFDFSAFDAVYDCPDFPVHDLFSEEVGELSAWRHRTAKRFADTRNPRFH